MSVYIKPCRGCPLRDGCGLRDDFRARASGIGARSVTFNCPKLASEVRVGRRIMISTPIAYDAGCHPLDGPQTDVTHEIVKATVYAVRQDYSFGALIDKDEMARAVNAHEVDPEDWTPDRTNDRRYRRMQKHSRILSFLDEPDWGVCEFGGQVIGPDKACTMRGECVCKQWRAME